MNGFRCDLRGSELLPETPTTIHYAQFYRCSIIIIIIIMIMVVTIIMIVIIILVLDDNHNHNNNHNTGDRCKHETN